MRLMFAGVVALGVLSAQDSFSISGRVVDTAGEGGVANAMVQLVSYTNRGIGLGIGRDWKNSRTLTAGPDGVFHFASLTPGEYAISAWHSQFAAAEGSRPPMIKVGPSQRDIVIRLTRYASIEGTVTDQDGAPVEAAEMQVIRYEVRGGKRHEEVVGHTRTDDRGFYRLAKLPAGDVYLKISAPDWGTVPTGSDRPAAIRTSVTLRSVFAGGAARIVEAQPLSLNAGEQRTVDLRVVTQAGTRVTGTLSGHKPDAPVSFELLNGNGEESRNRTYFNARSGVFAIQDVLPGAYRVRAVQRLGTGLIVAEVALTVPAGGLDDVRMAAYAAPEIPLRLEPAEDCSVVLESDGGFRFETGPVRRPGDPEARFTKVPPGVYLVSASCPAAYLATVRFGTEDVSATRRIVVPPGSAPPPLTLEMRPGASAEVEFSDGSPGVALLLPEPGSPVGPRLLAGRAENLTPGRYTVYSLPREYFRLPFEEPDFHRTLSGGQSVTLIAGETTTIKLAGPRP